MQVITTLSQLEDLADSVADIGKCGVSPLVTKEHLSIPTSMGDISAVGPAPTASNNMDCLVEEGNIPGHITLNNQSLSC